MSEQGRVVSPEEAYRRALALHRNGRLDPAVTLYRRILASGAAPDGVASNLGAALCELDRAEEGLPLLEQAAADLPRAPSVQYNLASALDKAGRDAEAEAAFRRVVALEPDDTTARVRLAKLLLKRQRFAEAEAAFRRLALDFPRHGEVLSGLGLAIHHQGRHVEALDWHAAAAAALPDSAEAHSNLGMGLLLAGRLAEAWPHMRWRMRSEALRPKIGPRNVPKPEWDGSPLGGRTLLVHCEQGFGDNIQFLRYVARIPRGSGGGKVIVACQQELASVFRDAPGVDALAHAPAGGADQRVDLDRVPFDCQIAMLDLPAVFATDLGTIPADIPYLIADPARIDVWRPRLDGGRFRLGLVHAGSPTHGNDKNRSLRLEMLQPLWDRPDVAAYLLHKDTPEVSFEGLVPLGPSFGDFADTAAALQSLDLLVSVDTSVAHLAGALGRPVWTLIPFVPDWRWLPGRDDTPWYPQMRLFRQAAPGDWDPVLARVATELDAVLRGETARLRPAS